MEDLNSTRELGGVDLPEPWRGWMRPSGHADLLREAVDGRIGADPPGPAFPLDLGE